MFQNVLWLIGQNKTITIDLPAQGQTFHFLTPHFHNKKHFDFSVI